jgi:transposase
MFNKSGNFLTGIVRTEGRALRRAGVEATALRASSARFLAAESIPVIEVNRPSRRQLWMPARKVRLDRCGGSRPRRAQRRGEGHPKSRDGIVEAIRALQGARGNAVEARTQAGEWLRSAPGDGARDPGRGAPGLRLDHVVARRAAFD